MDGIHNHLAVRSEGKQLVFGVLMAGTGKAWADDLQLLVDGRPLQDVPRHEIPTTALDLNHEFDRGSGITMTHLSAVQIDNLVALGKVWGFLKYHHPAITSGQRHWDYTLFEVLPVLLQARDRAAGNAVLMKLTQSLGELKCDPCASLSEADLQLRPDLAWIGDKELLGADLSGLLQVVYRVRAPKRQFYLDKDANVGNPVFRHEPGYENIHFPDAGFQLLALYRFWNIVEYWSPNRAIVGEDWDGVLKEFVPRIALAKDAEEYQLQLFALIAMAHDGHANFWSSQQERPPVGACHVPVAVRFVQGVPVVAASAVAELKRGDAITAIDGVPVEKLVREWTPYYPASNEPARLHQIGSSLTRGACGETHLGIRREEQEMSVAVKRMPPAPGDPSDGTHDLAGPAFRLLSKEVAYLKLSSVKMEDAAHYIEQAAGTKGLIIDIRNYPSAFVVFALGSHLVDQPTAFARFTNPDLSNPGAFYWTAPDSIAPQKPHYEGKIVVLADETSISQAEYTTMAFRSARRAVVVGSTTDGADGNVSPFVLPGGRSTMISGIGVFYPDQKPTQQIGILPDVEVKPTIAGIRAGRDEVLEEAVRQIAGRAVSNEDIAQMLAR